MTKLAEFPELLRRALDLKPDEARALVERLVPVLILADATVTSEPGIAGGRVASGFISQGAVAGQNANNQLFNPAGSGVVIGVRHFIFSPAAGGPSSVLMQRHDVALATLVTNPSFLDRRIGGNPVGELRHTTQAGVLGTVTYAGFTFNVVGPSMDILFDAPVVLLPGEGIVLGNTSVNEGFHTTYIWREIPL